VVPRKFRTIGSIPHWLISSRSQTLWVPGKQGGLSDVVETQVQHADTLQTCTTVEEKQNSINYFRGWMAPAEGHVFTSNISEADYYLMKVTV